MNSVVYTGLLTYHRANGVAGTKLMPGLATALPKITDGGRTYTMTLRKGLKFSNGKPAVASDFTYAFERVGEDPVGRLGPVHDAARRRAPPRTRPARPRRSRGSRPTTRPARS